MDVDTPLEQMTDSELREHGVVAGRTVSLLFASGISVKGDLGSIERRDGKITLMKFTNCRVTMGDHVLFAPAWGAYDMSVGEKIVSVFNGAADNDAYHNVPPVAKERTLKITHDTHARRLHSLYQQVRDVREKRIPYDQLPMLRQELKRDYRDDWLASLEILEILFKNPLYPELRLEIKSSLDAKAVDRPDLTKLLRDGLQLIF